MKVIIKFCDKTMAATATHIDSAEKTLKKNIEKEKFKKIKETISRNEEATKRVLKQRKFKKFNYLNHKPDTERNQQTSQTTTITLKPTYASILKNNTNVASNSINQNTNRTGERSTLQQKLQSFTSKHSSSRFKSPSKKASKTNQQNQSNEIVAFKAEIEELKQQKQSRSNTEAKTHKETNSTSENSKTTQQPKNVQATPKEANWKK